MIRKTALSLLSPAIALTNRLSFAGKFLLLGLIALAAICITLYSFYASLRQPIAHSRDELRGLALIRPLIGTVQFVQQHRGLSAGVLSGSHGMEAARAAVEKTVEASFAELEEALPDSSRQLGSWKAITARWKRIRADLPQWTRDESLAAHTQLIDALLQYGISITDDYGLTSDSGLETFYLTHISSNELMNALEHLGLIRAYGINILGAKQITAGQIVQLSALIALLEEDLKPFNSGMGKVARYSPETGAAISASYENFRRSARQVISEARSDILGEQFARHPEEFFLSTTAAINSGYEQLYKLMLPTAEKLIQARLQRHETILQATVAVALLLLLLVIYLTAAIYRSTLFNIRTLARTMDGFARGDMRDRVRLETRDELDRIGSSFNGMADDVVKLIEARQAALDELAERGRELIASRDALQLTQFAVDHAGDGVYWIDADGRIADANEHACLSLEYARAELAGMHIWEIDPDSSPAGWAQLFARLRKEGALFLEARHRRKEGAIFPVEISATHVSHGDREYSFTLAHDISRRKRAEETLRRSETLFRTLYESTSDAVMLLDGNGFFDCNRAALAMFGCASRDEFCSKPPADLSPPRQPCGTDSMALAKQKIDAAMEHGSNFFEWMYRRTGSGEDFSADVLLNRLELDGKTVLQATVRDITERKHNEARIERLSRIYRLLSRTNEAIVRIQDRDALFTEICNAAVESGLFRFAWIGMLDESLLAVAPVAYAGIEGGYADSLNIRLDDERTGNGPTGRAIREDTHIVCHDIEHDPSMAPWRSEATRRGYRTSGVFPLHQSGRVIGSVNVYAAEAHFFTPDIIKLMLELAEDVSFALDVFAERSRRETAENEIRQLNAELERRVAERTSQLEMANRELASFSYSVSHDLRAPLRSIDGFSQILSKRYHGQLDATGQDYLERVRRASQRMGHLIDDLLLLSQVARGELKRGQVDLSWMAEEVVEGLRRMHPERNVRFTLQPGLSVYADPGLMRIVIDNLLGNAWKYTGKKGEAEIEFGMRDIDGVPAFFVRDNGAGFSMDYAHKLFGAFQRLHAVSEFEGTGIGLATVQRIIQRHHGRVWADAREGAGATFCFTLPQREQER